MTKNDEKINGWKSIGAFFGKDRTTAMRWAQSRGLPIHKIPGGKTSTVYAFKSELSEWAKSHSDEIANEINPIEELKPKSAEYKINFVPFITISILLALISGAIFWLNSQKPKEVLLPKDPQLTAAYLQARNDWAKRTPESIEKSIITLEEITKSDAQFAPAFAALAEAYILAREFSGMSDEIAFSKAERAAKTAIELSPDIDAAHRVNGFIAYWWHADAKTANKEFKTALRLSPNIAQTHFWYGNILSDLGLHKDALKELNIARSLEPGSTAIETDYAWALFAAGNSKEAEGILLKLKENNPNFAVIFDCLSIIELEKKDFVKFTEYFALFANAKNDARAIAQAKGLKNALSDSAALKAQILANAILDAETIPNRDHSFSAFIAMQIGEKAKLIEILKTATNKQEKWGASAYVGRIEKAYANDAEIIGLLNGLKMKQ